jgi:hypothetical protein
MKCPPSSIFVDMHVTSQQGSSDICIYTNTNLLHSKLYSVCPSKYQDHSKSLKHLPINIWSATNTFMWLIPVVTSPKLPLMRSKFIQDGGNLIISSENISRTKEDKKIM